MTLRKLHGLSALLILVFLCVHVANHLAGVSGIDTHLAFMRSARLVYRSPAVEILLLLAVVFQIYSGIIFVVRGWKQRHGFLPWLQAGSGAYLAFFFLNHVGAILYGRTILQLDTNFYFAAAGFYVSPFQFFFAPYYFLGVLALFTHLGCALYWLLETKSQTIRIFAVSLSFTVGFAISLLIVLSLSGVFHHVQVPPKYKATYGWKP
jgi:hypothetical protein